MIDTRRDNLQSVRFDSERDFNAGLWLDKFIAAQNVRAAQNTAPDDNQDKFKQQLVAEVTKIAVPELYTEFYWRWQASLKELGAQLKCLQVDGRLIIGLGAESVLETSVTLHRVYGVPYIPGSALKGLAAFYARQELDPTLWGPDQPAYQTVFGTTETAGYVTFHDALYIPGTGYRGQPLQKDILTVHHTDYYQEKDAAPADWDSPVPVPLLSATGHYLGTCKK